MQRQRQKPRLGVKEPNNRNPKPRESGQEGDEMELGFAVRRGGGAIRIRGRSSMQPFQPYRRYRPAMKRSRSSSSDDSGEDANEPMARKVAFKKRNSSGEGSNNSSPSSPSEDEKGNRFPKLSAMEAEAVLRQELGIPDPVVAKKQAVLDEMPSTDDEAQQEQKKLPQQGPSGQPPPRAKRSQDRD